MSATISAIRMLEIIDSRGGAMSHGADTAGYNRLLRIAGESGRRAVYPGAKASKLAGHKFVPQEMAR
jgi:enolase